MNDIYSFSYKVKFNIDVENVRFSMLVQNEKGLAISGFALDEEKSQQIKSGESYFIQYNAPFPHDELMEVAKKCLITYGTILEKVMFRYKVPEGNVNHYSLGRLSGKIEVRKANLKKYRQKLTPA